MLSKIDRELNEKLMACSKYVKKSHGKYLTQSKVIELLEKHGQVMSQKELQDTLGIKSGSMSEIIIKLENKGSVEREKSEDDKRSNDVRRTEQGKAKYYYDKNTEHDSTKLFRALKYTEKRELSALL